MPLLRPLFLLIMLFSQPLWAQESGNAADIYGDPQSLIGLALNELIARFGPPESVHTSRGQEIWQDDVVFVYAGGEFYIFGNRVWQAGLKSACGVSVGDSRPAVTLTLGAQATDHGKFLTMPLPSGGWPLALRVNFSAAGRVSAIFIYRPDY